MLLLLTAVSALAASTPAPAPSAAPGAIEMGWMPDTSWQIGLSGLQGIADPMGVEAVFAQYGVDTEKTDLVTAERYGQATIGRRVRVQYMNLANGTTSETVALRPERGCTELGGASWSSASLQVHAAALGGEASANPSMVMVKGNSEMGSLVVMMPGDTVETRQVRQNGHLVSDAVKVRRNSEQLEVRREGGRQLICSGTIGATAGTEPAP
jgi:hypothetical protein